MTGKSNFFHPLPVKTTVGIDDALMSPVHDRRPEIWTSRERQPSTIRE
jgi:hypothetical protein